MPKQPKKRELQAVLPGFELPAWQGGNHPPAVRSRTSIAAAEAIAEMAPTLRGKVYREIVRCGLNGATRAEIAEQLGIRESTVCGRCRELLDRGLIYDTGTTRQTTSGRAAVVMRAK
jgi:DNA-binding NarL/FixJ family response regulator